jgi:fatty-acid desaturase
MKSYNLLGYSTIALHLVMAAVFAPPGWGPGPGVAFGFAYLVYAWFSGGLYLSDVVHMGIAHRALDYRPWFIQLVAVVYNLTSIYINPRTWVNRHRHHHMHADHPGDPNKLAGDGFWKTMYLCLLPYRCKSDLAKDPILQTWPLHLVSNPFFAVFSQLSSFGLLWLIVRDWRYSAVLWIGVRIFALWINMIQNYWTHDRRFGTRRYDEARDNAMNIHDWLPVTASFSASLQNNHHHHSSFVRLSHDPGEYDFGFLTVRVMKALGLVRPTASGLQKPADVPLREIGL